ncbi:MAG: DUF4292 domain-containing protein [Bacteroidetes bacterium]|nr:DUF4292 domain-containing protein [Bacteroidota bacterium]
MMLSAFAFVFRRSFLYLTCAVVIVLLSSCHTHRIATGSATVTGDSTRSFTLAEDSMLRLADANRIAYKYFATRVRVSYSDGKTELDFTAVIRMKRDSVIWLSLQGPFGIEGARVFISRDTVRIVNHLSNEYTCQPLSSLARLLPVQASVPELQDFLLGYYMHLSGLDPQYLGMEDSLHIIRAESAQLLYGAFLYPQNYTMAKSLLTDKMVGQHMSITFGGYATEAGHPFSEDRTIALKQGDQAYTLHLSYSKVRIDEPLDFPFEVSPGMKRSDRIRFE